MGQKFNQRGAKRSIALVGKEMVTEPEISDYASDGERAESTPPGRAESVSLQAVEGGGRSASDWVRMAQAMLQTPQRPIDRNSKTPEDSSKKKRRFQSGGLAERLNRLQCRQRSAVGFWRHQSTSGPCAPPVDKPGVLVLEVLVVREEASMQLAQCEPHQPGLPPHTTEGPMLVLFNKETAAQLMPAPRDIIHVYPPWQSLRIEGEKSVIILNTHFSQKVFSGTKQTSASSLMTLGPVEKCGPYSLTRSFGLLAMGKTSEGAVQQVPTLEVGGRPGVPGAVSGRCDSLLEAIESLGQAGRVGQDVEVVVQRVYAVPIQESSAGALLRAKVPCRPTSAASGPHDGRLCVLVQDSYGLFSVLQLQPLARPDRLLHYSCRWQGRTCLLRAVKVVRRVTRERCARLFSLIDSLWPPVKAPQLHRNTPNCQNDSGATGPAPSFCYVLAGQEASVNPVGEHAVSPLYRPPAERTLRQILQGEPTGLRCSFVATVIHKRTQSPGSDLSQAEVWLVVTDPSLQEGEEEEGREGACSRTLAVCVTTSCVLSNAVVMALGSSAACSMSFRDAVREHGAILCVEQSVLELHTPGPVVSQEGTAEPGSPAQPQDQHRAPPQPVRLDPLGPETPANSLCTFSGVIVGVDEDTAFSWPACSLCGSDRLEMMQGRTEMFHCIPCNSTVEQPTVKMQLEASMSCPALNNGTVNVKLQPNTIMSILTSSASEATEFPGYKVENVLGMEVGPIPVYARVVTRKPALWMGLEEICL
ncbi:DNA repair-scaffolding protein [Aplochiton taeniatus]